MYKKAVVKFLDIDKDGCVIRNPIIEKQKKTNSKNAEETNF